MISKYFSSLLSIGFILVLVVIVLGAYTRLSDAGLGCPDWPGCYGHVGVPDKVDHTQYTRPLEADKAWKEMIHRYAAGGLGLVILAIFIMSVVWRKVLRQRIWLPFLLLVTVIFQALLGMWTVTHLLSPMVVTAHLAGGLTTLSLLVWLGLRHHQQQQKQETSLAIQPVKHSFLFPLGIVVLGLVVIQILLGGWTSTNYAALACGDTFPLCQNTWEPNLDFKEGFTFQWQPGVDYEYGILNSDARTAIHLTHRIGALVVFVAVGLLAFWSLLLGRLGIVPYAVLIALVFQVGLGILNVVLSLPLWVAVGHTLMASCLLILIITLNFRLYYDKQTTSKRHFMPK